MFAGKKCFATLYTFSPHFSRASICIAKSLGATSCFRSRSDRRNTIGTALDQEKSEELNRLSTNRAISPLHDHEGISVTNYQSLRPREMLSYCVSMAPLSSQSVIFNQFGKSAVARGQASTASTSCRDIVDAATLLTAQR